MGKIYKDRNLTNAEKVQRFKDKAASIDDQLNAAIKKINWKRRKEAQKDIVLWMKTYAKGILLEDDPPPRGEQILRQMMKAMTSHENYMILMGRGSGKSVYCEGVSMFALACGIQKFLVIVSNNNRAAANMLKDFWKFISEKDTVFSQDYPEICLPYQITNGSIRKRQLYNGISTELQKTQTDISFPRLKGRDGIDLPNSGSVITIRSITSALRGLRKGSMRPSCVILDDLQDSEIANNPEQVKKVLSIINQDIMGLAGKERLSVIQTATPIVPNDLVDELKKDPFWKTTLYPSIISYPKNMSLWEEYFKIYDSELVSQQGHEKSLQFYKQNTEAMDMGSDVFNPNRFSPKDGHISAIQKLLEIEHNLGTSVFQSEYQMSPVRQSFVIDVSPHSIANKLNRLERLEIPETYRYITYGIDINPSYAISVVGIAWKIDGSGIVFYHRKFPLQLDQKLPDQQYNAKLVDALEKVNHTLKGLPIKPHGIGIDCGGRQWQAVTLFCKNFKELPVCAFAGRSNTQFQSVKMSRSRLKDAIGNTVLCGDNDERAKSGSGCRYVYFNADVHKVAIQKAFNCVTGDVGSLSVYGNDPQAHSDFAIEASNERVSHIQHRNGLDYYNWISKEPHDDLDCCAMAHAVLAQLGISGEIPSQYIKDKEQKQGGVRKGFRKIQRPRYKFV